MSTRSYIGTLKEDKQVFFVYCHFDGYPTGVGRILREYYDRPERVIKLLSFGNISTLATLIDDTVFYGRDRNEPNQEQQQTTIYEYLPSTGSEDSGIEYRYLFDEYSEEWSCYNMRGDLIEIPTDDLDIIR
jgi:hypothetical protein